MNLKCIVSQQSLKATVPFQTEDEAKTDETNGTMEDLIVGGEGLPTYGMVMYVDCICIGAVSNQVLLFS